MAENLIDLRRRIKSVENTQKSTRAMKTVSAAKLRRSVAELNNSKPLMEKIASILRRVGKAVEVDAHPLLKETDGHKNILVAISSDKGLCGAFNSHLISSAEKRFRDYEAENVSTTLVTVGNKAVTYFGNRDFSIRKAYKGVMARMNFQHALELSQYLQELYLDPEEDINKIEFIYTEYVSASKQEIRVKQLFPITDEWQDEKGGIDDDVEYIFEPSEEDIFKYLLPKYINSSVYQVLLRSAASEHIARMVAMELATQNASEMIGSLTLTMNKLRQASITNELLEIITATEALQK
ncbi:MAG: ATP synthase F1 subunit gamma [bacterium]|nr:ATP synthase F1 subunit gamma [bacterium]